MNVLVALVAGSLFGVGLALGGMTDPRVVLGFLDLGAIPAGGWNPRLIFVMGGALAVTFAGYRLAWRHARPWFAEAFSRPAKTKIDARLLGGAALFGTGWGIAGYCPGPALASLPGLAPGLIVFVLAMAAGLAVARRV